jgi:hypothetical protein
MCFEFVNRKINQGQNNLGNGTFPLMGNLRVLILDSCSINTLHPDTFVNLGRASTTNHQSTGLRTFEEEISDEY